MFVTDQGVGTLVDDRGSWCVRRSVSSANTGFSQRWAQWGGPEKYDTTGVHLCPMAKVQKKFQAEGTTWAVAWRCGRA